MFDVNSCIGAGAETVQEPRNGVPWSCQPPHRFPPAMSMNPLILDPHNQITFSQPVATTSQALPLDGDVRMASIVPSDVQSANCATRQLVTSTHHAPSFDIDVPMTLTASADPSVQMTRQPVVSMYHAPCFGMDVPMASVVPSGTSPQTTGATARRSVTSTHQASSFGGRLPTVPVLPHTEIQSTASMAQQPVASMFRAPSVCVDPAVAPIPPNPSVQMAGSTIQQPTASTHPAPPYGVNACVSSIAVPGVQNTPMALVPLSSSSIAPSGMQTTQQLIGGMHHAPSVGAGPPMASTTPRQLGATTHHAPPDGTSPLTPTAAPSNSMQTRGSTTSRVGDHMQGTSSQQSEFMGGFGRSEPNITFPPTQVSLICSALISVLMARSHGRPRPPRWEFRPS